MKSLRKRIEKLEEKLNTGGEGFYIASYDTEEEKYTLFHANGNELTFKKPALIKWLNSMRGERCIVHFLAVVLDNKLGDEHPVIIRTKGLKQTVEDEISF